MDTSIKIGLYIAVVGSALVCLPLARDAFGMVKITFGLLGAVIMWNVIGFEKFKRTPIDSPIAAVLLSFVLSCVVSVSVSTSLLGFFSQPFYGGVALAATAAVFYACAAGREQWPDGAAICCSIVAIASGVACMVQHSVLCAPPFDLISGYRAIGTVGSPVFLGALLAITVPISMWNMTNKKNHGVGVAGLALGLAGVAACGSRGPILAAAAGIFAFLWAAGVISMSRRVAVYSGLAFLTVLVLWAIRLDLSDTDRYRTFMIAFAAGAEMPLLGWGPDTFFFTNIMLRRPDEFQVQASAHNDLLQAWVTTGAVGLAALLFLWARAFSVTLSLARQEDDARAAAVFGALVALFVSAKFNPIPPPAFIMVAALLGSLPFEDRGRPNIWILRLSLAVLLASCGIAVRQTMQDERGRLVVTMR